MYYSVFLMRRVIFAFLLVLFTESPLIAVATHGTVGILMILYVLIAKPFKKKVTAVVTIFGELFVIGIHAIGLGIMDPDQPDEQNEQFGFMIVGLLFLYFIVGGVAILYQVITDLAAECKARSE